MHPENVDPNQVMEATQVVDWDAEEEETERSSNSLGHTLQPVGRLHILDGTYGPPKDYPLYVGKNMIGRSPQCSVILPFPSISKMHAEIEISAWNEPAFLQDCGSLNGTRIMRPPKILRTKIKHRLRSKDLILLADLPCQYYRLNSPLPLVPRGPLTIEETPRAEGGTQPSRLLLAEDSEEEVDTHSKRCMENEPRTTPFPLTTIVPESDEEGLSPAPGGPGPSFLGFDLCSDTDEEEGQPPEVGEASSAASEGVIVKAEPDRMTTGIQRMKTRPAVQRYKDRKVKTDAGSDVIPLRVTRERSHLPGEDSDTDVEEEGSPVTPAIVPGKKRQILRGFGKKGRRAPGPAFLQERPAHRDTSLDKDKAPLAVPLEKGHSFVVINSDTDEEEEVSTAFALAHLKESEPVLWSIDKAGEEDRAQPQTASERDSDTDMEEELPRGKRETIPTDKDGALVTHSENSQPPLGDSDSGEETDVSSSGIQLNGSQPSTILDNADMEEDVPPGPAVPQMPVTGRSQADVEAELGPAVLPVAPVKEAQTSDEAQEADTEEGLSSAVAGVRKNQCPEAEDLLAWTTAVLEQKSTREVGAQGISPVAQVEQLVVYTGTPWEHAQPQREGVQTPAGWERKAYVGRSKNSKDSYGDPEKLCLPATQCFVEEESLESVLDAPWEVLATQPFCVSKFEAPEPQPVATSFQAHRSHPSSSRVLPHHQHPVHTEPMGTQGRETVEKGMGTQENPAERVTPEVGPLETEVKEWPPDSEKDEKGEEELARRIQVRVVAGDPQCQESDKVKNMSPERVKEGVEVEMPNDIHEKEMERQTLAREVLEREVEKPIPGREWKPVELGVNLNREETEGRNHHQKEQTISLVDPGVGKGALEGLASALIVSGSQGDGGKRVPMSPGRQQRGHLNCKMPPAKNASRGGPESSKLHLLHTVPAALAPPQNGLTSQSQKCSTPHPLASPPFPFEPSIPVPHSGSLEAPESLPSSEPNTRPWRCSRAGPPSLSSVTSKPHTTSPTDQPATSKRTSQATRGKVNRSSIRTPEPPVTPKPVSQVIRGRTNRSCIRTPEPVVPTGPELQPTSSDQPATLPLGRTSRSTIRTSEPVVPIVPELQPTSSDQPATPNPISRVTLGRTSRSTIRTLEPIAPIGPVNPNPIPQATRSRTKRSCVKIPEVVTPVPELQLPTYTDQPDTPEPRSRTTRGRAHKSSVTTLEPVIPTIPELQPLMSRDEPVTSKPISRATRSRTCNSSTVSPESGGQTPPRLEPQASTDQPVIPEVIDQNKTLRSSTPSATPVPILSDLQPPDATAQPAPLEPNNSRRKRAAGKQGSHTAPAGHRPSSATPKPESQSSTNQSPGAPRRADSPGTTHAPLTQNVKAAGSSGFTLGPKPEGSQIRKRPSTTTDSPPPQKRPRRGVSQKTVFPNKDTANRVVKEEDVVVPEPGKRREQAEEASPGRNLRKNRYNRGSSPHKVLFTGVVDTPGEQAVLALGGSLATTVNEASFLVTDRIRRTVKFLCALGRGIPILSLNWLHQSQKAGYFLPPEDFLVTDPVQEKNFSFSLRDALSRAQKRKLLEGYEIHVTAGVQPPPAQMGEIINCCGGTFLSSMPRSYKPRRVVVTCPQDMPRCSLPSRLGLPLVSSEFLLTGVLKQEATPEAFLLSNLQISSPEKTTTQLGSRK